MHDTLSKLQSWTLDQKEEDIRGRMLRDANGRDIGEVRELIADTDTKTVTHVLLTDGRRYDAHDIWIERDTLKLAGAMPAPAPQAATPAPQARATAPAARVDDGAGSVVVPLVNEEIAVGKRRVEAGGVRVETHVVSKPFDKSVRLRDEQVSVERRQVDQPLADADADASLRDRHFEMTAESEEAVAEKRAHVVEEIVIKKKRGERVEAVHDTVRHTEAEITKLPGAGPTHLKGAKLKGAKR